MNDIAIDANELCRSFGRQQALDNATFAISRGSVVSLLGPNGAGKTTLMKLLCGLIQPTSGVCSIDGDSLYPRGVEAVQKTGCLIDGFEPPGHATVGQLVSLSQSVSRQFDRKRAFAMLDEKKLSQSARWSTLSKGQRRWTQLIFLLCRGCEVLLLDEPADGLDTAARLELYQLIRRQANQYGVTALIATHIINDVEKVTDEVMMICQGRIVLDERLEDLREQILVIEFENESYVFAEEIEVIKQVPGPPASFWLRDITGTLDGVVLQGEISRRTANLEQLYFVITNEAEDAIAKQKQTEGVQ